MDLRQLRMFVAVARAGSFSRAAELTYNVQPTCSRQVAALERHLGVTLLDRHAAGVSLTDAGELLLRHADVIIEAVALAERASREASRAQLETCRPAIPEQEARNRGSRAPLARGGHPSAASPADGPAPLVVSVRLPADLVRPS